MPNWTNFWFDKKLLDADELYGEIVIENMFVGIANTYPGRSKVPFEKIEIYSSNDRTIHIYVRDPSLDIIDLTGATAVFTVKQTREGPILLQKSTADPNEGLVGAADQGEVYFYITDTDTVNMEIRQYVYDVRVTLSNGKAYTVLVGVLDLIGPVNAGI